MGMEMRFSPRQELRQTQKLAPRLIASMEMLQLPILALQERIDQELMENPALEDANMSDEDYYNEDSYDDSFPEDASYGDASRNDSVDSFNINGVSDSDSEDSFVSDNSADDFKADDFDSFDSANETDDFQASSQAEDDFYQDISPYERSFGSAEDAAERYNNLMANLAAPSETLKEHLLAQLAWFDLSPEQRELCERIIAALNERGFIGAYKDTVDGKEQTVQYTMETLFPELDEKSIDKAYEALKVVQQMDPAGVGARDLRECLLLQIRPDMPYADQLKVLIGRYLLDLEQNRLPQICKSMSIDMNQLQALLRQMRTLTTNPGSEFQEDRVDPIVPDLFLVPKPEGGYEVRLDESESPRLRISSLYRNLENSPKATKEEKEYIRSKIGSAQWFIEAIEQRKETILAVSQAIVDYQQDFFDKGPECIRPLVMQQIADKLNIDVSTVSRAVKDKWMQTPRGVVELRKLFGGGTPSAATASNLVSSNESGQPSDDGVAYAVIRAKIKELVDEENKRSPLSDDAIAETLQKQGFDIARRTVAKYRQELNIPSSRQRKSWVSE